MTSSIVSMTTTSFLGGVSNSEEMTAIKQDLEKWCDERKYTPEYTGRQTAVERILEAYKNNSSSLCLSSLSLSSLPQSLGKLSCLKKLYLSTNQLKSLPAEIANCSQLREIDLSRNQLQSMPEQIGSFVKLEGLYLSHNQLKSVSAEIGNLSYLKKLYLSNNQLTSLPAEIAKLSCLKTFYLSYNQLESLPEQLANCSRLRELDLSHNQLKSLPAELANYSQLGELDLSHNQLESLPAKIGKLSRLNTFCLSNNQLTSLPAEIADLSQLGKIDLSNNRLQSVPTEIGSLSCLKEINFSSNQLQSLPTELAQLSSFCKVYLEQNLLSVEVVSIFQGVIAERKRTHPDQGPEVQFSIYESTSTKASATLQQALTFWIQLLGAEVNLSSYQSLMDHDQADMLLVFLNKLRRTQDFKDATSQPGVVKLVNQMLKSACTNEVFQEKMFLLLHDANDTCHDRTTITLGRMELEWRFTCDLENADATSLAKLIIGYRRLELLNEIADKKIAEKGLGDAIETKLYYQTRLNDTLGLPISTGDMLYEAMSGITTEELEDAALEILSVTSSTEDRTRILLESERGSEAWKNLIEKEHSEAFSEISEFYLGKMMNDLDYDLPQEEYMNQMNAIVEEKKQKAEQLMRDLTAECLNHSPQG